MRVDRLASFVIGLSVVAAIVLAVFLWLPDLLALPAGVLP